jgi:hypothetical protein
VGGFGGLEARNFGSLGSLEVFGEFDFAAEFAFSFPAIFGGSGDVEIVAVVDPSDSGRITWYGVTWGANGVVSGFFGPLMNAFPFQAGDLCFGSVGFFLEEGCFVAETLGFRCHGIWWLVPLLATGGGDVLAMAWGVVYALRLGFGVLKVLCERGHIEVMISSVGVYAEFGVGVVEVVSGAVSTSSPAAVSGELAEVVRGFAEGDCGFGGQAGS